MAAAVTVVVAAAVVTVVVAAAVVTVAVADLKYDSKIVVRRFANAILVGI